jgi:hypothetical protein
MKFNLSKFLKIANVVIGPVLMASGVPTALIPIVQHGITAAELASANRATPLTGAEKKALVVDAVATGIAAVNTIKPGAVDPTVAPLVDDAIDVTIATINAINKKSIIVPDGSVVSILD